MSQWTPGIIKSFKAGASLSAYRIVYLSAANTVSHFNTTTAFALGVTQDAASSGTDVPVMLAGTSKLYFLDTIAAGALVGIGSTGAGVAAVTQTVTSSWLGIANETVSATGTIAEVILAPHNAT